MFYLMNFTCTDFFYRFHLLDEKLKPKINVRITRAHVCLVRLYPREQCNAAFVIHRDGEADDFVAEGERID